MIISPNEIIKKKIVYSSELPLSEDQFQPNGIDVRVDTIDRIGNGINKFVLTKQDEKFMIPLYSESRIKGKGFELKSLVPYCVECFESTVVPLNMIALVYGRSTLNRNGILIRSSVYDSGFICKKIGFTLYAFNDCYIERGARIAQIVFMEAMASFEYNGSYQG